MMVSMSANLATQRIEAFVSLPGETSQTASFDAPGFHVLSLNASWEYTTSISKLFKFPYDAGFHAQFVKYGGMLVLRIIGCSGPNGTMTLYEGTSSPPPRLVETFQYHGQETIALSGTQSYGLAKDGSILSHTWSGMENATMDWKLGIWNYTMGFMVQKQTGQVLGKAELTLLYTVPQPEPMEPIMIGGGGRKCKG